MLAQNPIIYSKPYQQIRNDPIKNIHGRPIPQPLETIPKCDNSKGQKLFVS
jgi:hypothetical protein